MIYSVYCIVLTSLSSLTVSHATYTYYCTGSWVYHTILCTYGLCSCLMVTPRVFCTIGHFRYGGAGIGTVTSGYISDPLH